jgi:hypothetical protein
MLHQNSLHRTEDYILTDNSDFVCPDLRRDLEGSENWDSETRRTIKRDRRHSLRSVVTRPQPIPKLVLPTECELVLPLSVSNNN